MVIKPVVFVCGNALCRLQPDRNNAVIVNVSATIWPVLIYFSSDRRNVTSQWTPILIWIIPRHFRRLQDSVCMTMCVCMYVCMYVRMYECMNV